MGMGDLDHLNRVFAKMGSDYRAYPGGLFQDGVIAMIEAIPGYVDRQIKAALDARETKE